MHKNIHQQMHSCKHGHLSNQKPKRDIKHNEQSNHMYYVVNTVSD